MKRDEVLAEALKTLRAGGTILYPTDTVWDWAATPRIPKP